MARYIITTKDEYGRYQGTYANSVEHAKEIARTIACKRGTTLQEWAILKEEGNDLWELYKFTNEARGGKFYMVDTYVNGKLFDTLFANSKDVLDVVLCANDMMAKGNPNDAIRANIYRAVTNGMVEVERW